MLLVGHIYIYIYTYGFDQNIAAHELLIIVHLKYRSKIGSWLHMLQSNILPFLVFGQKLDLKIQNA